MCILPIVAGAQALKGSYFSENSVYRTKLNPAFTPRSSYLGFGIVDNLGLGVSSNLGLSDFMYPGADGKLLTALHPDVSSETFLNNLPANPYLDLDVDTDILNIGFFTGKNSFWSFAIGTRVDAELDIPKEFFSFLKNGAGSDPQDYSIRNFNIVQNAYLEASLGYSHDFSDILKGLHAGVRAKFIAAVDRLDLRINSIDMRMGSEMWSVKTDATAYLMMKGVDFGFDSENNMYYEVNPANLGLAGMGAAFDLGAEYRLPMGDFFDSIRFSAAITDLGFIRYSEDAIKQYRSGGEFQYEGLNDMSFGEGMNMEDSFSEIQKEFATLANLEEVETDGTVNSRIKPQLYIGVEMPFLYNKMSIGLLYNAKFGYTNTRNELTLAYNLRPGKWINIGVNYSMLNTWKSFGWLLELTPRAGINFFVGSDYTFLDVTPQFVPVNELNFNLRFGFSLALGNRFDEVAAARRNK